MAREANPREPKTPRELVPPPRSFSIKKAAPSPNLPKAEKVSGSAVVEEIKEMGRGWDKETESSLRIPPSLFRTSGEGATYFSDDENFGVALVASGLRGGRMGRPESMYGICIYDTPSSVYFVLLDMERRIIVRERLSCVHDRPPEKDWSKIRDAIRAASAAAEKNAGSVAIFDGILKVVPIQGQGEASGR